jgi:LPXTG-motif cell wall-anchored protein
VKVTVGGKAVALDPQRLVTTGGVVSYKLVESDFIGKGGSEVAMTLTGIVDGWSGGNIANKGNLYVTPKDSTDPKGPTDPNGPTDPTDPAGPSEETDNEITPLPPVDNIDGGGEITGQGGENRTSGGIIGDRLKPDGNGGEITGQGGGNNGKGAPKTGDDSIDPIVLWSFILAAAAIMIILIARRRRKRNEDR